MLSTVAIVAYDRLRMLWGALDWQHGTDHPYTSAETHSGGDSAVVDGGIGVRRAEMVFLRTAHHAGGDAAVCHFDWLNVTSGAPDDTWITSDFTTLEDAMKNLWLVIHGLASTGIVLTEINWYRIGTGVTTPNPAERAFTLGVPIAGTASNPLVPPQVASSLTLRNAVRKSWGRTYLPLDALTMSATNTMQSADVDTVVGAANDMVTTAAGGEYILGTYSARLNAFLAAEHVEMDDVTDVIRRRRWKQATYKKVLP